MKIFKQRIRYYGIGALIVVIICVGIFFWFRLQNGDSYGSKNLSLYDEYDDLDLNKPENVKRIKTLMQDDLNNKIDYSNDIHLPEKYNSCKGTLSVYQCILVTEAIVGSGNMEIIKIKLDKYSYISRFEEVLKYQDVLFGVKEDVNDLLAMEYYKIFRKEADVVFQQINNVPDQNIKNIIINGRMDIIDDLFDRNLITESSTCNKIPIIAIKDYCNSKLY